MHQTPISHILVSSSLNTIASLSTDGIVKFWKKTEKHIELLRSFKCHTKPAVSAQLSRDQRYFVSCSTDRTIKIFDLLNCELIHFLEVDFEPSFALGFVDQTKGLKIVCLEANSSKIRIKDPFECTLIAEHLHLHKRPVVSVAYCQLGNFFISVDEGGMIEYWTIEGDFPSSSVHFGFKSETDLYALAKTRSVPYSLATSSDDQYFAILCSDFTLRVFAISTGKIVRTISERPGDSFTDPNIVQRITKAEQSIGLSLLRQESIIFDATNRFVIYPNFTGIKICTIDAAIGEEFDTVVGWDEKIRFVNLGLYQGDPTGKFMTLEMAASQNPAFQHPSPSMPCLFCTGMEKNRFFLVTRNEPKRDAAKDGVILASRDAQNERVEASKSTLQSIDMPAVGNFVVLHTDLGDIKIELFPEKAPKTVTNFVTHCKNGFFNGVTFHRVVRDFMIQTGDPTGTGTGGVSIWNAPFEDEFHSSLSMDKAFMVCMANSGPNSNGSQFFITVVPTPWLNGKHTIFGKVVSGFETALKISMLPVNKRSCPLDSTCIRDVEIKTE